MSMRRRLAVLGIALVVSVRSARAGDEILAGTKLVLKQDKTVRLVIRDPATTVPAAGSADDPSVAQSGLQLTLYGHTVPPGSGSLTVPPGAGWRTIAGPLGTLEYRYRPTLPPAVAPVRALRFRAGKGLKVAAKQQPLLLAQPQGAVGVVVRFGDSAVCTLFGSAAVRRDVAGFFTAGAVPPPPVPSCDAPSLAGATCAQDGAGMCGGTCTNPDEICAGFPFNGCRCISSLQPCGNTAPACNGECPSGEECLDVGGVPFPGCACLPAGSTGCGGTYGACGGDCPSGSSCASVTYRGLVNGCGCTDGSSPCGGPCPPGSVCVTPPIFPSPTCLPNTPCTPGGAPCQSGTSCELIGGSSFYCVPIPCTGGSAYPTCGGGCDVGLSCQGFASGGGGCFCAP